MRRLAWLSVLVAFVFSCGGEWYVLQGIAWVRMIHDYAQVVPFTEAVGMTFSGQYPCHLCQAIAEKKESENNQLCSFDKYEKFFPPVAAVEAVQPAVSILQYADYRSSLHGRTDPPPTPPPRQVLS